MSKKVLLVGHCGPDTSYLRLAVRAAAADATIVSAHDDQSLAQALAGGVDVVLINRVLDGDFDPSGGIELISQLREAHPNLKLILISNYPDAQAQAVRAGAQAGFGKRDIGSLLATQALKKALT